MSKNKIDIVEKINTLESGLTNVSGMLTAIESSLYFASERQDKDMTKPCSAALEAVISLMGMYSDIVWDIKTYLEENGTKEV